MSGVMEEVGVHHVLAEQNHVPVGVDEAGQQGLAGQIDHLRGAALELHRAAALADIGDLAAPHRESTDVFRRPALHREEVTAEVDGVGGLRRRRCGDCLSDGGKRR
jgi:hypothetical protein